MGFLSWRGWDRLDDVDAGWGSSVSFELALSGCDRFEAIGFVWVLLGLTQAALNLEREAWVWICIDFAAAVAALLTVVWATRQLRGNA